MVELAQQAQPNQGDVLRQMIESAAATDAENGMMPIHPRTPQAQGQPMSQDEIAEFSQRLKLLAGRYVTIIFAHGETAAVPISPPYLWTGIITTKGEGHLHYIRWFLPDDPQQRCGLTTPEVVLASPPEPKDKNNNPRLFLVYYVSIARAPPSEEILKDMRAQDGGDSRAGSQANPNPSPSRRKANGKK
jgi:hypothetical protein